MLCMASLLTYVMRYLSSERGLRCISIAPATGHLLPVWCRTGACYFAGLGWQIIRTKCSQASHYRAERGGGSDSLGKRVPDTL